MAWRSSRRGPDGPRSWFVACAAAWNIFWLSLVRRSGGVVYVALVTSYGATREQTTWTISISFSIACILGPVVGLLTKCLALRTLSLVGSSILALSTILCFFAEDMTAVFALLGVLNGIGMGILLVTNDVVIGQYFRRYRGSGFGIYYTGGTLAAFIFPPLMQMLIQEYGLRGTFLITGGLSLNGLVGSLFYRTPPWASVTASKVLPVTGTSLEPSAKGELSDYDVEGALLKDKETNPDDVVEPINTIETSFNSTINGYQHARSPHDDKPRESSDAGSMFQGRRLAAEGEGSGNVVETKEGHNSKKKWTSHLSFLKVPVFYMVAVTCMFSVYATLVFMILVDLAEEKGFSRQDGAVLLSVSAIGDAGARLLSGVLSDKGFMDRRAMMGLNSVLLGSLVVALPWVHSYVAALALCALLGWACGTLVVLFGPLMADHLGVENLGVTMGICRFMMGAAYLGCPKITGTY
ncbi:unnamed protein product, partial [Ixodes hexagonus]